MNKIILSPEQRRSVREIRDRGFMYTEARYDVLTPEQKRQFVQQKDRARQRRWAKDPVGEMLKNKKKSVESAKRRGKKYGAHEFTITREDLPETPPICCPVFNWIKLEYPGRFIRDPAGATLERIDVDRGYVPGNVEIISWRANELRKNARLNEINALAEYYSSKIPENFLLDVDWADVTDEAEEAV